MENSQTNRLKVPQYLYRPYQVLFFETDELVVLVVMLFFGIVFGGIFWLLIIPTVFLLIHLKKKYPRGYIKHVFYRLGLLTFKNAPTSFERKFNE